MSPTERLESFFDEVTHDLTVSSVANQEARQKVEAISRCSFNKAPIRFVMACLLAKLDRPSVDIRKPYTEISGDDTYSGRHYDEAFLESFVAKHKLPCNSTTAFLTPAFRNIDRLLSLDFVFVGRPKEVYENALAILDLVHRKQLASSDLLKEFLRILILIKAESEGRMQQLLADLKPSSDKAELSSEQILTLLQQHLACKNSSRLPVLMVTAAYQAIDQQLEETTKPLHAHNAADKQTGSIGDIEVILTNDESVVTCYEMKDKRVAINDLNHALTKIAASATRIDNYIFITTDVIEREVIAYAQTLYDQAGIEVVVLACLNFIRHYLHFFHRHRSTFLDSYQQLVLNEPNSSVGQPLKEAFLVLRKTAESN